METETTPKAPASWLEQPNPSQYPSNTIKSKINFETTTKTEHQQWNGHSAHAQHTVPIIPLTTSQTQIKEKKSVSWKEPTITSTDSQPTTPTTEHPVEDAYNTVQRKYTKTFQGRMRPHPSISHHPAYETLLEYATDGCPVDCGDSWTMAMLEAAIARGNHSSAQTPEAVCCLRDEALEKVQQGYARIVKWDDIRDKHHPNLKISPLAAVPHKSRTYRAILDLSFQLRVGNIKLPSVNSETKRRSNHTSMEQMGKVLPRLVYQVARADPSLGPLYFAKWDIKDGFWRLVVSQENAWHFCYLLPKLHIDDPTELVVPTCLQMGWLESPPLFCTTSETARDIAQELLDSKKTLPPHALEQFCLPPSTALPKLDDSQIKDLIRALDVYMDDFIGMAAAHSRNELLHFTRAVLHGIHTVFPPPGQAKDPDDEPISVKKLKQGEGMWATKKEILGWLFDGTTRCINLPANKTQKIMDSLKQLTRKKTIRLGELEKLNGKLMHATIGIPNGRGLLSPIIATIAKQPKTRNYKERSIRLNSATKQALVDWKTLLPLATRYPTPCTDLIPAPTDYGGYCDASKAGAGGVWFGLARKLPPIVWRVPFPSEIQAAVVSANNPKGTISNSDLEMMGLLLQWLVLERVADLQHAHVACWCDNTPTVAWATRLLSTKATNAARILRILALRMLDCQASPITTQHIAGELNTMADFASRSFNTQPEKRTFLTEFESRFPLPQNASWNLCCLPNATVGRVLSTLSTPTSNLGSWRRPSTQGSVIGCSGSTSYQ